MRRGLIIAMMLFMIPMEARACEIPADIKAINEEAEAETNVSRHLLGGLEFWESGFQQYAVNKAGTCFGLCQINKQCHRARMERLGVTDIYDKRGNIMVAADLLEELFAEYEDVGMVLLVYGGASNKAKERYLKDGTLPKWAQRIIDKSIEFEKEEGNDSSKGTTDAFGASDNDGNGQDGNIGDVFNTY